MPAMDRAFRQERVGAALLSAIVDHYARTHDRFDFLRGMEDYKVWYTDGLDMNLRVVAYRTASFAAFVYNLRESIRRFAVDLGLPKAVAQAGRRVLSKIHGDA
jgi:Acetyltransferase (GNAT) domain